MSIAPSRENGPAEVCLGELISRLERIWKIALACLLTILSGALWAARIQWQVNDLGDWKSGASVKIDQHGAALERMKGHLGISAVPASAAGEASGLVWRVADPGHPSAQRGQEGRP